MTLNLPSLNYTNYIKKKNVYIYIYITGVKIIALMQEIILSD